jgi:hypothetical protein
MGGGASAIAVLGLRVEGFQLAGPAAHPEQDARLAPSAERVGLSREEPAESAQSERGQPQGLKERAAADSALTIECERQMSRTRHVLCS